MIYFFYPSSQPVNQITWPTKATASSYPPNIELIHTTIILMKKACNLDTRSYNTSILKKVLFQYNHKTIKGNHSYCGFRSISRINTIHATIQNHSLMSHLSVHVPCHISVCPTNFSQNQPHPRSCPHQHKYQCPVEFRLFENNLHIISLAAYWYLKTL